MLLKKIKNSIEEFALKVGEKVIRSDEMRSVALDIALMNDYLPRSIGVFLDIINGKLVAVPLGEMGKFEREHNYKLSALPLKKINGKFYYLVNLYDKI